MKINLMRILTNILVYFKNKNILLILSFKIFKYSFDENKHFSPS